MAQAQINSGHNCPWLPGFFGVKTGFVVWISPPWPNSNRFPNKVISNGPEERRRVAKRGRECGTMLMQHEKRLSRKSHTWQRTMVSILSIDDAQAKPWPVLSRMHAYVLRTWMTTVGVHAIIGFAMKSINGLRREILRGLWLAPNVADTAWPLVNLIWAIIPTTIIQNE